ncbi:hypothetical protein D1614_12075 [Maribellus luteus]|uniref:Uncharacterized protein n=1 Tax=Maribellus luteus TaxID=2305463 RepID=A0A399SZ17_9BACT|nr:hypothetical protein D1614_12075 [Maribellus luteus]
MHFSEVLLHSAVGISIPLWFGAFRVENLHFDIGWPHFAMVRAALPWNFLISRKNGCHRNKTIMITGITNRNES